MLSPPQTRQWPHTARFVLTLVLLAMCFLLGGGSRDDIPGLAILEPAAVLLGAVSLLLPGPTPLRPVAAVLMLLGGLAAVIVLQLIPLPPGIWMHLPGHAPFASAADAAGLPQPWRPISLTPDLTLASLVSLSVPAAVVVMMAALPVARRHDLLPYLIGAACVSALIGVTQIAGGPQSSLYLYKITNYGAAVGFFSNRNHQATLLLMTIPMLALWASATTRDPRRRMFRRCVAVVAVIALLPMLAVTGSRAGILLAPVALFFGWLIFRLRTEEKMPARAANGSKWMRWGLPAAAGVAAISLPALLWRTEAFERLLSLSVVEDQRVGYLPVEMRMIWDFLPFGSGFGSFDPVFRYYEPFELLQSEYLNHAHNDLTELAITAGLPGIALLLLFLAWALPRGVLSFLRPSGESPIPGFARLGAIMLLLLLVSSLFDYPLRTPLMAAMFAVACVWLAGGSRPTWRRSAVPIEPKSALRRSE